MNYSPIFTAAARTERAHSAARAWIANDAPVLEQRLKQRALAAAVNILELAIGLIDFAADHLERVPEYRLQIQIAWLNTKRLVIRQCIKAARFDERYQVSAKAAGIWNRKGQIVTALFDRAFCLTD